MLLNINGQSYTIKDDPDRLLLWVLRDELGLTGSKFGCGIGVCGACTVHVDGQATRSCITPLSAVADRTIRTLEGLAETASNGTVDLHPVQQAFLEEQVHQCGYCMTGQMMTAAAFLEASPEPSEAEVVAAMDGVLCRCGAYGRIKRAVLRAADILAEEGGA